MNAAVGHPQTRERPFRVDFLSPVIWRSMLTWPTATLLTLLLMAPDPRQSMTINYFSLPVQSQDGWDIAGFEECLIFGATSPFKSSLPPLLTALRMI